MVDVLKPLSTSGWVVSLIMALLCAILSFSAETQPWWVIQVWDSKNTDDSFSKSPCSQSNNFLTISLTQGMCINDDKEGLTVDDDDVGSVFNANCVRWDDGDFWSNANSVIDFKAGANCLTSSMGNPDFSSHALKFANGVNFTRSAGAMACLAFLLGCCAMYYKTSSESIAKYCHAGFVTFIIVTFILNCATFGGISGGTNPIQKHENWYYLVGSNGWPEAFPTMGTYGSNGQCTFQAGACIDTLADSYISKPYAGFSLVILSLIISLFTFIGTVYPVYNFWLCKNCYADGSTLTQNLV